MTRGVIKDIKSGRRGARESGGKERLVRERQRREDRGRKRWETLGGRGRKINRLLYAASRMCPLAPDSLSKDSNSQQTN